MRDISGAITLRNAASGVVPQFGLAWKLSDVGHR